MADEQEQMRKRLGLDQPRAANRSWAAFTLIGAAALLLGWHVYYQRSCPEEARYTVVAVERGGFDVTVSATGAIEPTNLVEVSSELSGTLAAVLVDFNDTVAQGAVLARLDTTKLEAELAVRRASLEAAEARVAVAEAALVEAQENFEVGAALERRKVQSRQALIGLEAAFERAKAELDAAKADRKLAQANITLLQADLDKATIRSPVKGVVLDRAADSGQIVAASLSAPVLFTVAEDLTRMELRADVDEADIDRISVGNPADFTVEAYDERVFPAMVEQVRFASETIDGVVTYKVILTVDNAEMALRPGMTATARILVAEIEDVLLVPNAALRFSPPKAAELEQSRSGGGLIGMILPRRAAPARRPVGSRKSLWVLRDGAAVEVAVETGDTDGRVTAILGGDLAVGDLAIVDQIDER